VILVDSNIPMYLVGADHPHKARAQAVLEAAVTRNERLLTDAEVLQEILHRYVAIGRRDAIQPAFESLLGVVDEVLPIGLAEVQRARDVVLADLGLSARDAIHIAVMERHGIDEIMSFDTGLDRYPGLTRRS